MAFLHLIYVAIFANTSMLFWLILGQTKNCLFQSTWIFKQCKQMVSASETNYISQTSWFFTAIKCIVVVKFELFPFIYVKGYNITQDL